MYKAFKPCALCLPPLFLCCTGAGSDGMSRATACASPEQYTVRLQPTALDFKAVQYAVLPADMPPHAEPQAVPADSVGGPGTSGGTGDDSRASSDSAVGDSSQTDAVASGYLGGIGSRAGDVEGTVSIRVEH